MKMRVVPMWQLAISVGLNVLLAVGLVVVLLVPSMRTVRIVEVRVTATPSPVTAATATVLPTTTDESAAQSAVTDGGVMLDTSGIREVRVVGIERTSFFSAPNGQPYRIDDAEEEFLVVYLRFPRTTTPVDLEPWFEDNATLLPAVVDENGYQTDWQGAFRNNEPKDEYFGLILAFVVKKSAKEFILIFPDGARVDLSLVPDLTPASSPQGGTTEGQASEPADTPTPAATDAGEAP